MKIFTINPGSTSTKIALFEDENCIFTKNVKHDASELSRFESINDQLPYREQTIMDILDKEKIKINECEAYVGRGGGLIAMEGGTYEINALLLDHAKNCANGVIHPANLGSQLAYLFNPVLEEGLLW